MNIKRLFKKKKTGKSFFDFSSKEKKQIIKKAVHESSEMQRELLKKYEKKLNYDRVSI